MTAAALAIENLTAGNLCGIESQFGIALAALDLAAQETKQRQSDRESGRE